jgi:hypothetical protein
MAIIKLFEPYSITYLRNQVRDSLMYHGEEAIALALVHVQDAQDPDIMRCPRCADDGYNDAENDCPVCFGVNFIDRATGTCVRHAQRVWALFTDHSVTEQLGQRGVWAADAREVQLEAFPLLMEHDVIVRVRRWDTTTHTALSRGEFYGVQAVTRNSLRTGGNRFSQTKADVIGQKANCSLLSRSVGITNYPILGETFPEVTITGTPEPVPVAMPDTKVIYVPTTDGHVPAPDTGSVIGATLRWNAVFTYTQTAPATVWTINHSLGHFPEVTVYVGGEVVLADVDATSDPQAVTITFQDPQSGYAELS